MGRTACTEPQCLYRGALYFTATMVAQLYLNVTISWNYVEKECNDVAVCRVWRYGRSLVLRKSPKTRHGMCCCCANARLPVVVDAIKVDGKRTVRHVTHDSEGVEHSLKSIVTTR
jgi:hypothetical protein